MNSRGQLVLESAGPIWHLIGVVKRDTARPNRLMLTRPQDALSRQIKSGVGKTVSIVDITDLYGNSARLINARIYSSIAGVKFNPQPSSQGSSISWSQSDQACKEEVTFEYGALEVTSAPVTLPPWHDYWLIGRKRRAT
jgi:hypothetical protein